MVVYYHTKVNLLRKYGGYEAIKQRIQELEDYKEDVENSILCATDEQCTLDEKHCTCVGLLRVRIKELETENAKLKKLTDDSLQAPVTA